MLVALDVVAVVNSDLDLDEKRAAALPQDYERDFDKPNGWTLHTCGECLKTFRSLPTREVCRKCEQGL